MKTLGIKLSVLLLKYLPFIGALIMLCHVFSLVTNNYDKDIVVADWTFSLPAAPAATALVLSKQLGFCNIHRHFIIYTSAVSYCIKFQDDIGFGLMLTSMRWIALIIGIILFIWLFIYTRKHNIRIIKHGTD